MKTNIEEILKKLNNVEQVLKMLVVSSVLKEEEINIMQEGIIENTRKVLEPLGMRNPRIHTIEMKYYVFVEMEEKDLKKIKDSYFQAIKLINDMKIVLAFDKLHQKRRKSFEDAKISYYISNGEMKIF